MRQIIDSMKQVLRKIPPIRALARRLRVRRPAKPFPGSERYWIERYAEGGGSGVGSYGDLAEFKAEVLNNFVEEQDVISVIEYGCGDGGQLRLAVYPAYLGFDVSHDALSRCEKLFHADKTKQFKLMSDYDGETAELTLSLDVVYHLAEDDVYESYMMRLFDSATRFVIIYSTDQDEQTNLQQPHVRHRRFTKWVDEHIRGWRLGRHVPNTCASGEEAMECTAADFYIYEKT